MDRHGARGCPVGQNRMLAHLAAGRARLRSMVALCRPVLVDRAVQRDRVTNRGGDGWREQHKSSYAH